MQCSKMGMLRHSEFSSYRTRLFSPGASEPLNSAEASTPQLLSMSPVLQCEAEASIMAVISIDCCCELKCLPSHAQLEQIECLFQKWRAEAAYKPDSKRSVCGYGLRCYRQPRL